MGSGGLDHIEALGRRGAALSEHLQNEVVILSELNHPCAACAFDMGTSPAARIAHLVSALGRNIVPLLGSSFDGPAPCVVASGVSLEA